MKKTKPNDKKVPGADKSNKNENIGDNKQAPPAQEKQGNDNDPEKNNPIITPLDIEPKNMELEIVGMSGHLIDNFNVTEKGLPEEGQTFWEENKATKLRSVTYYFKEDTTLEQLGPPPNDFPEILLKTRITLND
jgi:hypothetical protein